MTESKEREAYRMKCKHYGCEGNCGKRSYVKRINAFTSAGILFYCTPDCDCARMRRYDKRMKEEQI